MAKRIVLIKFQPRLEKKLREALEKHGVDYDCVSLKRIDSRAVTQAQIHTLFYLYSLESSIEKMKKDISKIKSLVPNAPITVVFAKRDFDALLVAHELGLTMVLGSELSVKNIGKALIRSELRSFDAQKSDLPLDKLTEFLASPIKVKADKDLFRILKNYFKSFSTDIECSLINYDGRNFDHLYGEDLSTREIFQKIKNYQLPKIYIGQILSVVDNEKVLCAFPLYAYGKKQTWCLCNISVELKNYILNDLFFRHLENTLIYRKSREKITGYLELAHQDDVTGLFNQRKLHLDLEKQILIHKKANKNFSLMFIDIDHFKKVNDEFGHLVGSKFLTEIADLLRQKLRTTDKIYRYGGDEFVVLMPRTQVETVYKVAGRIAKSVREHDFKVEKSQFGACTIHKLTLSVGIAQYPCDAETASEIIQFADAMMYASKKSGRGKIFHVGEV